MEQTQNRRMRVTAGFDGYVDTISRVVKQKGAEGGVEYFSTIAEFGAYVTVKAGKSASIELRTQRVRAGGNLPLFALALCALGVEVTAMGAMGWPQLHPAFAELAQHPPRQQGKQREHFADLSSAARRAIGQIHQ